MLSQWIARAGHYGQTGATRINALDGWRGIAIAIVLLSHFGTFAYFLPFERVVLGRMGVDFFFVLSGLLMSNILFVKRTPLKVFYQRRISRIFPVFIVFVTVIYGMGWWLGKQEAGNYLSTLTFLRSYIPAEPSIWRTDLPVAHIWSLNVEEHCYILLSLITLIGALRYREYLVLFMIAFASIALRYLYIRFPEWTTDEFGLRTETAAAHLMLSAGYFLIRDRMAPHVPSWLPVLALMGGIACYSLYAPWFASWAVAPFAFAFAVNHLEQAPRWFNAMLSFRPLQLLGIWSYSIYLWQEPFYRASETGLLSFPGQSLVFLAGAFVVGLVSFYALENPVRRFLNDRYSGVTG
ncbi:MAG: acyltransferase [Pseudomonadota bacterium]